MWKVIAGTQVKQRIDPEYYTSLTRLSDDSFKDFAHIIELDVKRTYDALASEVIAKSMNRILLNYAKYIEITLGEIQK